MSVTRVPVSRLTHLLGDLGSTPGPAYRSLAEGLRLLVIDGRLLAGSRLPAERELAVALGLSRTTVSAAYAHLRDQGYAYARRGSGTNVRLPDRAAVAVGTTGLAPPDVGTLGLPGSTPGDLVDLGCAAPSPANAAVARAYADAHDQLPHYLTSHGYTALGLPELRSAIADRYTERGLPTEASQVVVTNGALAGLRLVLAALARPGDRALLEAPSYPNAIDTIERSLLRSHLLPVEDGWDVEACAAVVRQTNPHLAYLMPDFHNPTGLLMPDQQRADLAWVLRAAGATTIVDETVAELTFDDAITPHPYAVHDDTAVCLGSASKAYWGGLRVGWVRAPHDLIGALTQARTTLDLGAGLVEQLASTSLLRDRSALNEQRTVLRRRRDHLLGLLPQHLPDLQAAAPSGGLSLWVRLPHRMSSHLVAVAARHGLVLAAGPRFTAGHGLENRLRLPFTSPEDVLDEAVARLGSAYEEATATMSSGRVTTPGPLIA